MSNAVKTLAVDTPKIERLTSKMDAGAGARARIGLLVLASDQTMETEFRSLTAVEGVSIYHSRLAMDPIVTPETLVQMETEIPVAARLLPKEMGLKSIGYGCTSGSTMIGEARVAEMLADAHPGVPSTNPLTAASVALGSMDVKRFALVTPYSPDVTDAMRARFVELGFEIPLVGSFYQSDDFVVGKIDEASILEAASSVGSSPDVDGVFISCTSLRAVGIIEAAESRLGKPVTASNHALAWHLLRLAGVTESFGGKGRLFRSALKESGVQ